MHMESPERHLFGASIEGQESPLFSFLFTLSPIKPIKSLHASQSFTELSFPPPPVFVTPKVHAKRSHHRNSHKSEQTITLTHSDSIQNNGKEGVSRADQRSTESQNKSAGLLCTSPSHFVEPQLAECMEVELTSTCSMNIEKKGEHMVSSLGHPEALQNGQPSEPSNVVHLCSEALDIDKGAAVLVPLLSEVPEKTAPLHENLEGGEKVISSTLLDTFDQHTSGYHHAFCGSVDKNAQGGQVDSFLMQMSTGCGDGESTKMFREQQDGAANKVNYPVQRGFRRRCLDFRASDCHWTSKVMAPLKSRQSNSRSRSQNTATYSSDQDTHLRILNKRILETSGAISSDSMPANPRLLLSQSDLDDHQLHVTCPPCGASPSPPNILSGIGLHLNSLTGSVPVLQSSRGGDGTSASVKFSSAMVGAKSQSQIGLADKRGVMSHLASFENSVQSRAIFDGDLVVCVAEKTELVACKGHISSASESMACVGSDTTRIKQPKEYASCAAQTRLPTLLDQQERVLLQAEDPQTDFDCGQDNCTSSSAKNMRKRALTADSFGDGCKRCNCKKSKCLKLYCECFAAGLFCIDSCSCHDCHNKPSYEAMVLETRQSIQSRNPLAFAPKVMRTVANSPMIGVKAIDVTPASARHKKGCSCKKSKCLKKYCECYQEGVGCSEGCRCENCENLYGKKEGSECSDGNDVGEDLNGKEGTTEKTNTSSFCSELNHAASYQQDDLTPTTPSFQYTGTIDSSTMYQSSTRRRSSNKGVQSPDSLLPSTKLSKTIAQPPRSSKAARNNFDVYKTSRQLPSSRGRLPRAIKSGQFSPRWEGLDDICTLTPLPQAPLPPTTPSVSFVYRAVSSPSLNMPECSDRPSSCSDTVSKVNLAQCSSPTKSQQVSDLSVTNHCGQTPADLQATPDTALDNAPFCGMGLESPYEDTMFFCTEAGGSSGEDAIPAILKDPEPARSSMFCLKSNSPKQKRVSPPHFVGSRITSQGRGQSPALRNGRKFTLQSVSSIPTTTYSAM